MADSTPSSGFTDADFQALIDRVTALESRMTAAESTIAANTVSLTNIQTLLAGAQTAVGNIRQIIRQLIARLSQGALVDENGAQVAAIQTALPPEEANSLSWLARERERLARR